jgi:hypothetical protein
MGRVPTTFYLMVAGTCLSAVRPQLTKRPKCNADLACALLVEIGRSGIAHDLLLADHGLTES